MTRAAMVMAGGSGLRMKEAGIIVPKPLVPIADIPLIEWNVRQLLKFDFDEIFVVAASGARAIAAFAETRLRPFVTHRGASFMLLTEAEPLGNFGAVKFLAERDDPFIVVFADNLTTLDLGSIYRQHTLQQPAMTIATHEQPFMMPFGSVTISDGKVKAYLEKPVSHFSVCSGISVVGPTATGQISPGEAIGISGLVQRVLASGCAVDAFAHDAPWIDVNDKAQIGAAEQMVRDTPALFESLNGASDS